MKKMVIFALILTLLLTACAEQAVNEPVPEPDVTDETPKETAAAKYVPAPVSSDSLYVKKAEGIGDDFIMGMDASSVIALEASGVKYYAFDGEEQDVFRMALLP